MLRDKKPLAIDTSSPEAAYRSLPGNYPKFFKMDILSKWAWLGAEVLLKEGEGFLYEGKDKEKIAVVLATRHGCLDVDKRYQETVSEIPSPALFVYTLSNIMLGEICIRHGFKGEQTCLVQDSPDPAEIYFWVKDLLEHREMDACLCGWVDAYDHHASLNMFWIAKHGSGASFTPTALAE